MKSEVVDEEVGRDEFWDELPEELSLREERPRRIRKSKAALEAVAQVASEQTEAEGREHPGVPDNRTQRNFTAPDSGSGTGFRLPGGWPSAGLQHRQDRCSVPDTAQRQGQSGNTKTGCYGAKLERAWAPQRPLTWVIIHSER